MVQRIFYGLLALAVIFVIILMDVTVARILQEPLPAVSSDGSTPLPMPQLDAFAESPWGRLLARGSAIPLAVAVMTLLGAWELYHLLLRKSARPHMVFAIFMILAFVLSPWFCAAGWLGRTSALMEGMYAYVVLAVLALVGGAALSVFRLKPQDMIRDLGATWLMIFWLGFLPSFAVQMRCGVDVAETNGAWLLLISLIVIKASDIGAYFFGTFFGRTTLAAHISPSKSVEGMLGGLFLSTALACAVTLIAMIGANGNGDLPEATMEGAGNGRNGLWLLLGDAFFAFGRPLGSGHLHPLIRSVIFGVTVGAFAQIGDLLESGFKRDAGLKDSGRVLPRFGGILDLIDSPVLALPVAWFLLIGLWSLA